MNLDETPLWANIFLDMLRNGELMQLMSKFVDCFVERRKP